MAVSLEASVPLRAVLGRKTGQWVGRKRAVRSSVNVVMRCIFPLPEDTQSILSGFFVVYLPAVFSFALFFFSATANMIKGSVALGRLSLSDPEHGFSKK